MLLYLEGVDNMLSAYLHNDDEGSDVACFTQGRDSKLFLLVKTTRKKPFSQANKSIGMRMHVRTATKVIRLGQSSSYPRRSTQCSVFPCTQNPYTWSGEKHNFSINERIRMIVQKIPLGYDYSPSGTDLEIKIFFLIAQLSPLSLAYTGKKSLLAAT